MKMSVLIVDDEEKFRKMFCFLLEPLGLEVVCARDGQESVDKVKEKAFDLIFMDVHMPKLQGPEAIKQIKAFRPEQKIVLFSSSSDPTYSCEDKLEKEWGIKCLYKPVEIDDIYDILDQMIGPISR